VLLSIFMQILYVALYLMLVTVFARFTMGYVLSLGRRWEPGRRAAAGLEVVWSVTDPPLKALRRVIPPLRIGTVSFDLASIVLIVILVLLKVLLVRPLI
jgi:YggT family protein